MPPSQARGWSHDEVLFVDDSQEQLRSAQGVCRTLLVAGGGGMGDEVFREIRAAAGVDLVDDPDKMEGLLF